MHEGGPSVPATRPVFVDASGRRGRWLHRLFVALGVLMATYVGVVLVSLVAPSSLSRLAVPGLGPVLPGPGAPGLRTATGGHGKPAVVLGPHPSPSRLETTGSPAGPVSTPGQNRPTVVPSPTAPSPAPSARPTTSQTAAPSPVATGRPASPAPRSSQTPPGQTSSAHPSPHSSHARGGSPQPSPTP